VIITLNTRDIFKKARLAGTPTILTNLKNATTGSKILKTVNG